MPRGRKRARVSLRAWLLRALAALGALWLTGFAVFLVAVFTASPPNPLPPADGIVALTGGDERISTALALLAEHEAPLMLISGAGRGTYIGDYTADDAAAITRYAAFITLGHAADSTYGNGQEAAAWARAHHMHALIIVTADYHMPRALAEMRRAMPDMTLIPAPVRPPAMRKLISLDTLRLLAAEYSKYVAVRLGLGPPLGQLPLAP